jgi:hypothetical protein
MNLAAPAPSRNSGLLSMNFFIYDLFWIVICTICYHRTAGFGTYGVKCEAC